MLTVINQVEEVQGKNGEIRAGGTDLHDRYRAGVSTGPIVDIHKISSLNTISQAADNSTTIGALVSIDTVGNDPIITTHYTGLAQPANGLATPQIRWAASLGGGLLQRTRCAYYRHPDLSCTKKGDDVCGGREGHHPNGVIFDRGGCSHAHPSSLAIALLAYDATVKTATRTMPIADLYGDGSDHGRDHLLADDELLTHIVLPPPVPNEKTAYFRSISRFEAEWPIVECMVRLGIEDGVIVHAAVGAGGISQIPMRLSHAETALIGKAATAENMASAAETAAEGATPLPQAAWKADMLVGTLLTTLEMALTD